MWGAAGAIQGNAESDAAGWYANGKIKNSPHNRHVHPDRAWPQDSDPQKNPAFKSATTSIDRAARVSAKGSFKQFEQNTQTMAQLDQQLQQMRDCAPSRDGPSLSR
jgi:hypothetical protein